MLHLDLGGEMGLTAAAGIFCSNNNSFKVTWIIYCSIAVEILAEFARTRHLEVTPMTAVQLFIAADALDVEGAR